MTSAWKTTRAHTQSNNPKVAVLPHPTKIRIAFQGGCTLFDHDVSYTFWPNYIAAQKAKSILFHFYWRAVCCLFLFCYSQLSSHRIEDKRSSSERWRCTNFCRLFNQFERYVVQLVAQKPAPEPELQKNVIYGMKKKTTHMCIVQLSCTANRRKKYINEWHSVKLLWFSDAENEKCTRIEHTCLACRF